VAGLLLLALPAASPTTARAVTPSVAMLRVPAGDYRPFYKGKSRGRTIPVASFLLDREPVSERDFLAFVTANPRWRRSQVTRLYAESSYLSHWTADLDPAGAPGAPVTRVSWFAASAYCECEGKRLPTQAEWEWAAERGDASGMAGVPELTATDGVRLASLERASRVSPPRGDLHFAMGRARAGGLVFGDVWEWTSDFNTLLLADPSPDDENSSSLFCGDGFRATDAKDYGGFLRFSFRSSLKASYALKNLGFRCAKDLP
jgi:formylglycine-generating enzyme required for sulfatase activity